MDQVIKIEFLPISAWRITFCEVAEDTVPVDFFAQ